MYLAQRQQLKINSDGEMVWKDFLDVRETNINELSELCVLGTSVYTSCTNHDVLIMEYSGGSLRDLVIAEDWRSTVELFHVLTGQ